MIDSNLGRLSSKSGYTMEFLMALGTDNGETLTSDHPGAEMEPMSQGRHRLAKPMRYAARAIAIVGALCFLTVLIGAAVTDRSGPITMEGVTLGLLGALALAACIISWWRERLAALLLIGTSVSLGIHIAVCAGHGHLLAWSIIGMPYLLAGLLLLGSWQLSRQASSQHP